MDYTPNDTRDDMISSREKITSLIKEYMTSEGYQISSTSRFSHSLDAFHYQYQNAGGNRDMIKIELNYSMRAHIFEPVYKSILPESFNDGMKIKMLEPMEIFAAGAAVLGLSHERKALVSIIEGIRVFPFCLSVRLWVYAINI